MNMSYCGYYIQGKCYNPIRDRDCVIHPKRCGHRKKKLSLMEMIATKECFDNDKI